MRQWRWVRAVAGGEGRRDGAAAHQRSRRGGPAWCGASARRRGGLPWRRRISAPPRRDIGGPAAPLRPLATRWPGAAPPCAPVARRRRLQAQQRRPSGAVAAGDRRGGGGRLACGAAGVGAPPNPSPSRPLGHWFLGRPERPDKPRRPARQPCPPGPKAAVGRNRDCLGPPPNSIYYFQYLHFSKDLNSSICTSNNLNSANSPQVLIRSIMYYIYLM